MPTDIVKQHRLAYRNCFMNQTLDVTIRGAELRVDACVEIEGETCDLCGKSIAISFKGPAHPDIYATNCVAQTDNGGAVGLISVNPALLDESRIFRKTVLAREWLEVMLSFRDGTRANKRVMDRINTIMLIDELIHRGPWMDTPEEASDINSALRLLLVSKESLGELASEHGLDLAEVGTMIASDPADAQMRLFRLADHFAMKWSVRRDLVLDRLGEILS